MKKILTIICACIIVLSVCGCSVTDKSEAKNDNGTVQSDNGENTAVTAESIRPEIKRLIDNNIIAIKEVTGYLNDLDETPLEGHYYAVKSDTFKTTQDIKDFLNDTYTSSAVATILSKVDGYFLDIDGKLYVDMQKSSAKGYLIDWDNYTYTINSVNDTECNFTVTGKLQEMGENIEPKPYTKDVTAVKENGKWLLTEEFY